MTIDMKDEKLLLIHDVSILTCISLHHLKANLEATLKEVQSESAAATTEKKNRRRRCHARQTLSRSITNDLQLALEHLAKVQAKIYHDAAHEYDESETEEEWRDTEDEKGDEEDARDSVGMSEEQLQTPRYKHDVPTSRTEHDHTFHSNGSERRTNTRQGDEDIENLEYQNGHERDEKGVVIVPERRNRMVVAGTMAWWICDNLATQGQLGSWSLFHSS